MREIEKRAWIETIIPMPGPASKRLAERLIRRTVKHEVIGDLGDLGNIEPIVQEPVPQQEIPVVNNNPSIIYERDALLNKVASFNEKYNV